MRRPTLMVQFNRLRARQHKPMGRAFQPTAHHRRRQFRVKLNSEYIVTITHRLHRKSITFGQKCRAIRQFKSFDMPLIDKLRILKQRRPFARRTDREIADLAALVVAPIDLGTQSLGQHLPAKTNAEEWLARCKGNIANPVNLCTEERKIVVHAHWPAKNHSAIVVIQRCRQRFAKRMATDIQFIPTRHQRLADPARIGVLLMEDNENALRHIRGPV